MAHSRHAEPAICPALPCLVWRTRFLHAMPHAQPPCGLQADMPGRPHPCWMAAMHARRSPCSGRSRRMHLYTHAVRCAIRAIYWLQAQPRFLPIKTKLPQPAFTLRAAVVLTNLVISPRDAIPTSDQAEQAKTCGWKRNFLTACSWKIRPFIQNKSKRKQHQYPHHKRVGQCPAY